MKIQILYLWLVKGEVKFIEVEEEILVVAEDEDVDLTHLINVHTVARQITLQINVGTNFGSLLGSMS